MAVYRNGDGALIVENEGEGSTYALHCTKSMEHSGENFGYYLFIPRAAAKGHLEEIFNEVCRPDSWNGPGSAFWRYPILTKVGRLGWLMSQSGGLDV